MNGYPHNFVEWEAKVATTVKLLFFWGLLVMLPMTSFSLDTNTWQIVPLRTIASEVDLPPLAVVERQDDTGQTWQKSGTLAGDLIVAHRDFKTCLMKQGWRLDKVIPMGTSKQRSMLCLWKKEQQEMLVMLWDLAAGKTGFSMGKEGKNSNRDRGRAAPNMTCTGLVSSMIPD